MKVKFNEATANRPTGTRYTDADILKIDLPAYITQLRGEEAWKTKDRNAITVVKSDNVTITLILLAKNAQIIPGSLESVGFMTLSILEGKLEFMNGKNTIIVTPSQILTVHEQIPFSAVALEETVCLLTMIK